MRARRERWGDEAERALRAACGDELADIRAECESGHAWLMRVAGRGFVVVRPEARPAGSRELVLVAAAGAGKADDVPAFLELARALKCDSVRAHSRRPGMGRYLARHGFREVERVYRAEVNDGRR